MPEPSLYLIVPCSESQRGNADEVRGLPLTDRRRTMAAGLQYTGAGHTQPRYAARRIVSVYREEFDCGLLILSTKYALLRPDTVIAPYNVRNVAEATPRQLGEETVTPSELGAKVRAQESFAALAEAPVVVLGSAFFIDTIIEHVWNHAFAPLTRVTNVRARYSRSNWLDPRANIGAYLDTFASERL